jgi:hypothetical protein
MTPTRQSSNAAATTACCQVVSAPAPAQSHSARAAPRGFGFCTGRAVASRALIAAPALSRLVLRPLCSPRRLSVLPAEPDPRSHAAGNSVRAAWDHHPHSAATNALRHGNGVTSGQIKLQPLWRRPFGAVRNEPPVGYGAWSRVFCAPQRKPLTGAWRIALSWLSKPPPAATRSPSSINILANRLAGTKQKSTPGEQDHRSSRNMLSTAAAAAPSAVLKR